MERKTQKWQQAPEFLFEIVLSNEDRFLQSARGTNWASDTKIITAMAGHGLCDMSGALPEEPTLWLRSLTSHEQIGDASIAKVWPVKYVCATFPSLLIFRNQ